MENPAFTKKILKLFPFSKRDFLGLFSGLASAGRQHLTPARRPGLPTVEGALESRLPFWTRTEGQLLVHRARGVSARSPAARRVPRASEEEPGPALRSPGRSPRCCSPGPLKASALPGPEGGRPAPAPPPAHPEASRRPGLPRRAISSLSLALALVGPSSRSVRAGGG